MSSQCFPKRVVLLPLSADTQESTDEVSARPDPVKKLMAFTMIFQRMQTLTNVYLPETLVKSETSSLPTFFRSAEDGQIHSQTHRYQLNSAQEAFFQAVQSTQYSTALKRPSPYHVPSYIAHTQSGTELCFEQGDVLRLIAKRREYVIQRFIPPQGNRATKHRMMWTEGENTNVEMISRKTPMPFNSPKVVNVPQAKTAARRSSFMQKGQELVVLVHKHKQLLKLPNLFSGSKSCSPQPSSPILSVTSSFSQYAGSRFPSEKISPYFACFSFSADCLISPSPDFEGNKVLQDIVSSFQAVFSCMGQHLTNLEFDVMKGDDGLWYFLDLEKYEVVPIEDRIRGKLRNLGHEEWRETKDRSANHTTLENLKEFFVSDKPLTNLKAPYIDPDSLQGQSLKVFRHKSPSETHQ